MVIVQNLPTIPSPEIITKKRIASSIAPLNDKKKNTKKINISTDSLLDKVFDLSSTSSSESSFSVLYLLPVTPLECLQILKSLYLKSYDILAENHITNFHPLAYPNFIALLKNIIVPLLDHIGADGTGKTLQEYQKNFWEGITDHQAFYIDTFGDLLKIMLHRKMIQLSCPLRDIIIWSNLFSTVAFTSSLDVEIDKAEHQNLYTCLIESDDDFYASTIVHSMLSICMDDSIANDNNGSTAGTSDTNQEVNDNTDTANDANGASGSAKGGSVSNNTSIQGAPNNNNTGNPGSNNSSGADGGASGNSGGASGGPGGKLGFPGGDEFKDVESKAVEFVLGMYKKKYSVDEVMAIVYDGIVRNITTTDGKIAIHIICLILSEVPHYRKYTTEEIMITGEFLGKCIEKDIFYMIQKQSNSGIIFLTTVIRCILKSIQKSSTHALFYFGINALNQFLSKMIHFPLVCSGLSDNAALSSVCPGLKDYATVLMDIVAKKHSSEDIYLTTTEVTNILQGKDLPLAPSLSVLLEKKNEITHEVSPESTAISRYEQKKPCTTPSYVELITDAGIKLASTLHTADGLSPNGIPQQLSQDQVDFNFDNINAIGLGVIENLMKISSLEKNAPPLYLQDLTQQAYNTMGVNNIPEKAQTLHSQYMKYGDEYIPWLVYFTLKSRASKEIKFQSMYIQFFEAFPYDKIFDVIVNISFEVVNQMLSYLRVLSTSSSFRTILRNLGSWIGLITIGRDKPIRSRVFDVKQILLDAYKNGYLVSVVPFISKLIEQSKISKHFRPPNPWVVGILQLLMAIHNLPYIKNIIQYEIEILLTNINYGPNLLPTLKNSPLTSLTPEESSDDFDMHVSLIKQTQVEKELVLPQQIPVPQQMSVTNPITMQLQQQQSAQTQGGMQGMQGMHSLAGADNEENVGYKQNVFNYHHGMPSGGIMEPSMMLHQHIPQQVQDEEAMYYKQKMPVNPMHSTLPQQQQQQQQQQQPQGQGHQTQHILISNDDINVLSSNIVVPKEITLFHYKPELKGLLVIALESSIKEIVSPMIDRLLNIAMITSEYLVIKDFSLEPDITIVMNAAISMANNLSSSLLIVTCIDSLRTCFHQKLKEMLLSALSNFDDITRIQPLIEQIVESVVHHNITLACNYVKHIAINRSRQEIVDRLYPLMDSRRKYMMNGGSAHVAFVDNDYLNNHFKNVFALPTIFKPTKFNAERRGMLLKVYESFNHESIYMNPNHSVNSGMSNSPSMPPSSAMSTASYGNSMMNDGGHRMQSPNMQPNQGPMNANMNMNMNINMNMSQNRMPMNTHGSGIQGVGPSNIPSTSAQTQLPTLSQAAAMRGNTMMAGNMPSSSFDNNTFSNPTSSGATMSTHGLSHTHPHAINQMQSNMTTSSSSGGGSAIGGGATSVSGPAMQNPAELLSYIQGLMVRNSSHISLSSGDVYRRLDEIMSNIMDISRTIATNPLPVSPMHSSVPDITSPLCNSDILPKFPVGAINASLSSLSIISCNSSLFTLIKGISKIISLAADKNEVASQFCSRLIGRLRDAVKLSPMQLLLTNASSANTPFNQNLQNPASNNPSTVRHSERFLAEDVNDASIAVEVYLTILCSIAEIYPKLIRDISILLLSHENSANIIALPEVICCLMRYNLLYLPEFDSWLYRQIDNIRSRSVYEFALYILHKTIYTYNIATVKQFQETIDVIEKLSITSLSSNKPMNTDSVFIFTHYDTLSSQYLEKVTLPLAELRMKVLEDVKNINNDERPIILCNLWSIVSNTSTSAGVISNAVTATTSSTTSVSTGSNVTNTSIIPLSKSTIQVNNYTPMVSSSKDNVIQSVFSEWLRVFISVSETERHPNVIVNFFGVLIQRKMLRPEGNSLDTFFRVCYDKMYSITCENLIIHKEKAMNDFMNDPLSQDVMSIEDEKNIWLPCSAYSKMINVLMYNLDRENCLTLNKSLGAIVYATVRDAFSNTNWNGRPLYRLLLQMVSDILTNDYKNNDFNALYTNCKSFANCFLALSPLRVPLFSFYWLELISCRYFVPRILNLPRNNGYGIMSRLVSHMIVFLSNLIKDEVKLTPSQIKFSQGCTQLIKMLVSDFPDFIVEYHSIFTPWIPPICSQMRQLICSCAPSRLGSRMNFPLAEIDKMVYSSSVINHYKWALIGTNVIDLISKYYELKNSDPQYRDTLENSPALMSIIREIHNEVLLDEVKSSLTTNQDSVSVDAIHSADSLHGKSASEIAQGKLLLHKEESKKGVSNNDDDSERKWILKIKYDRLKVAALLYHFLILDSRGYTVNSNIMSEGNTMIDYMNRYYNPTVASKSFIFTLFTSVLGHEGRYIFANAIIDELRFVSSPSIIYGMTLIQLLVEIENYQTLNNTSNYEVELVRCLFDRLLTNNNITWSIKEVLVNILTKEANTINLKSKKYISQSPIIMQYVQMIERNI